MTKYGGGKFGFIFIIDSFDRSSSGSSWSEKVCKMGFVGSYGLHDGVIRSLFQNGSI